jgi:hypothetical protein
MYRSYGKTYGYIDNFLLVDYKIGYYYQLSVSFRSREMGHFDTVSGADITFRRPSMAENKDITGEASKTDYGFT